MKNTVKLFGLIALITLIGFAACDDGNNSDNTDPDNPGGGITWSFSVNGTADTEDSTRITLTFSAAVTGLTADDITLTDGTGSAAKVSLLGSGTGYILNITVTTAGTVSLKVTKDGVSADAQDVTVHKKPGIITWSAAADGILIYTDSTKITFTFSAAVDGLTAEDITLNPITVPVTKGELTGGGTSWELGITVTKQGYITAAIDKTGVSAAPQQVQVFKEWEYPIRDGMTTIIDGGDQVLFNTINYTLNRFRKDDDGNFVYDENNKYTWQGNGEGDYSPDVDYTLTLTLTKVASDFGYYTPKADALPLFVGWMEDEIEREITERLKWSANAPYNETQADAEAAVLASRNEENGTNFTTLEAFINALAAIRLDETFAPRRYNYTFSNDNVSLILLEALPQSVGTNELAGKTFYGTISDWMTGNSEPNPDHTFMFFSDTYIETGSDDFVYSTGAYSYNSSTKRVYLQPAARNGKTPEQYYDAADYYDTFDRLSEADSRTSQTHQYFRLWRYDYDPAANIIDTKDSGEIDPL